MKEDQAQPNPITPLEDPFENPWAFLAYPASTCPECNGYGEISVLEDRGDTDTADYPCSRCNGTGVVYEYEGEEAA